MDRMIAEGVKVDAIITDPPYGTTACKWDSIIPFDQMWERLNKLIKPNGAIVLNASQPFTTDLINSNRKWFKYCWVWEKDKASNFALANKQPMKYHEDICVFYAKQPTYNKQMIKGKKPVNLSAKYGSTASDTTGRSITTNGQFGGNLYRNPKSVLKFNTPKPNSKTDRNGYAPTQKPVALMEYMVKTYTNEGETVLDFTMGSGTTGVACKNLNRHFIGIEIDKDYFEIAKKRIEKHTKQERLF